MKTIDFKEAQGFRVWWAWIGVAALYVLMLYAFVQQVILGMPFGNKPASDATLIITQIIVLLVLIFLSTLKLKTRITNEGIYYRFFPFHLKEKKIEWHELKDAYIRQYNSLLEYGGWGIRYGTAKRGNAVNTSASSNRGLQLQFNNGKLLLIGTRKPDEIQVILDEIMAAGKINRGI